MTAREIFTRLAIAAVLLVAIGGAGNLMATQSFFPRPMTPYFHQLPHFRVDWLHHQWVNICNPYPSEICAEDKKRIKTLRR